MYAVTTKINYSQTILLSYSLEICHLTRKEFSIPNTKLTQTEEQHILCITPLSHLHLAKMKNLADSHSTHRRRATVALPRIKTSLNNELR